MAVARRAVEKVISLVPGMLFVPKAAGIFERLHRALLDRLGRANTIDRC
jgi:hypothetical protein